VGVWSLRFGVQGSEFGVRSSGFGVWLVMAMGGKIPRRRERRFETDRSMYLRLGSSPHSLGRQRGSLTKIGISLRAQPTATALILGLFMAGFGVGQLIFGPLCDRLGRRPALLAGCTVFTIAAFGCAISSSIGGLVFWRFLQGIGAAAGPVISFAIVHDLFVGTAARKRFAYVGAVATLAPIIRVSRS